jgi:hypothetical protein
LPGSRTCSNAALFSRTQLPEPEVTPTVIDLLLSRLVTFSFVPTGNWPLEAAGAPPSPDSVTVEPRQTTLPLAGAWVHDRLTIGDPRGRLGVRVRLLSGDEV